jgi:hypothetical protein
VSATRDAHAPESRDGDAPRVVITNPDVYRILDGILAARRKAGATDNAA